MGANDREDAFREADRKYAEAAHRRDAGEITREEFDAERKRNMVLDKEGRWWAKSKKSGEWKYHDGKDWVPGAPPGYAAAKEATAEPEGGGDGGTGESGNMEGAAREVVDEGRSGSLRRPIAVAALLLVVLLVGGGYALTRGMTLTSGTSGAGGMGGTGGRVEVPDIIGAASIEEAKGTAGGDFEVVEAERVESEEPIGALIAQKPASGEYADENSTIQVDVSKGVAVPDVEGNTRDEAARTLEEAGFKVKEETKESSEDDDGRAIGQSPGGGEFAEAGSTVEVTVGEGPPDANGGGGVAVPPEPEPAPAPDERIPVPDVIGESVEDAEQTLENAGFSTNIEAVESGQPAGTVVWTDPDPGALLDPSSGTVAIGSSLGPPETPPESPPEDQYIPPDEGS